MLIKSVTNQNRAHTIRANLVQSRVGSSLFSFKKRISLRNPIVFMAITTKHVNKIILQRGFKTVVWH